MCHKMTGQLRDGDDKRGLRSLTLCFQQVAGLIYFKKRDQFNIYILGLEIKKHFKSFLCSKKIEEEKTPVPLTLILHYLIVGIKCIWNKPFPNVSTRDKNEGSDEEERNHSSPFQALLPHVEDKLSSLLLYPSIPIMGGRERLYH